MMADGNYYGLYLSPDEVPCFPAETVFPLFKRGEKITAYQVGVSVCPNLQADHRCGIYEQRPLTCRAYPVEEHGLRADCTFVRAHQGESITARSLTTELEAYARESKQAETDLPNDFKWPLNVRCWMEV